MNIEQAKNLRLGQVVRCPPDMGNDEYIGHVSILPNPLDEHTNINNEKYLWVSIKDKHNNVAVWPSNRLSIV